MLEYLRVRLPRPVKRIARAVLHPFTTLMSTAPSGKADWEFWWQQTQWLDLWKKPRVQAKCLEYWKRYRHLDDILVRLNLSDGSSILDVGCGLASVLHYLPSGRRIGVDPLGERYKRIYDYPFEVVGSSGENLPFTDESFDAAFCSNCIDHTSAPGKVIGEVLRVLRPGGHFVLTCEIFSSDLGARNLGHPHSFTIDRFLALTVGFEQLDHWASPWLGFRAYVLGLGQETATQEEHILLLQKRLQPL